MARITRPEFLPAALIAARGGMSASAFERQLRALGMGARSSEVRAVYAAAVAIVNNSPDDPFANQAGLPTDRPLTPWPTKNATGVKQVVTLLYRDKTTGEVLNTYYTVVTPGGIARSDAIAKAINAYSDAAEQYKQDLIGAVHTGAYQLTPIGI